MSLVTFLKDVFPYVKGEVRDLDGDEQKRVDAYAKSNKVDTPYKSGAHDVVDTVDGSSQNDVRLAKDRRNATHENEVNQAAILEAQRTAVATPANVDALGLVPEAPVTVTGTKPVGDVKVTNAQQATDIGSGEGVEVKGNSKK